ncbi:MAG TPA: HAD family hydrolase [Gemmatimonadaceae bacterium]|jgi:histidinol-phosphate phosphatase family protein|nr:HAD family hydrolase [Gemmatimonadaceae bacterium]
MNRLPGAVFLDRDGTVIEDAHYIKSPELVKLLPGAAKAIRKLNDAHVPVIVVTNQSGIGRGLITVRDYEAVRERFHSLLAREGARIDGTYYCPDVPGDERADGCRKPAAKMFKQAIEDFNLDPSTVAYIGDRWRDVAASTKLGGRAIMISSPMTTDSDRREAAAHRIETAESLAAAVEMLFGLTQRDRSP